MKIAFWRAAGVTAGGTVLSYVLWALTYPLWNVSLPFFVAKDILLTLIISGGFAWVYFKEVAPSLRHGLYLGIFMIAVALIASIAFGFADAVAGFPVPEMSVALPDWYIVFNFFLTPLVVLGAAGVGYYLARNK